MSNSSATSATFHKNVYLLSQAVPTSDDFKEHFREGMFDRPNTAGFIHVSQYLLTILDAERFKKLVQWPIHCKKTQIKYRNDVKDYLSIIVQENPDFGFPPIRASYLVHAGGIKFLIIMWKLSQLVLYTYLKREHGADVPRFPKAGPTKELTKTLLRNRTASTNAATVQIQNDFAKREEEAKAYAKELAERISKTQLELFERRKSLVDLASQAPVAPHVKKRLVDVEDTEIIQMWKKSIAESLSHLQKKQGYLRDLEGLSNEVVDTTMSMLSDSRVLDVNRLPMLNVNAISELSLPPAVQVLLCHLYVQDKLVLRNFLLTFNSMLGQLWRYFKNNPLPDMSSCQLQVQASCEDLKSACNLFHVLLTRVANYLPKVHNTSSDGSSVKCETAMRDIIPNIENILFMPSPTIEININQDNERNDIPNRLELTPIHGMHRALFSRHKRNVILTPPSMKMRTRPLISRINFDDTISSILSDKQSPGKRMVMTSSKMNFSAMKNAGKYSRLFSGAKRSSNREIYSSVPSCSKANSTTLMNTANEIRDVSELSLNVTAKSLFSLTISEGIVDAASVISTPENHNLQEQSKSRDNPRIDGNVSKTDSIVKISKSSQDETTEVKLVVKKCQQLEQNSGKKKRRSISDLVERYKKVLENSSTVTLHLESTAKSTVTIEEHSEDSKERTANINVAFHDGNVTSELPNDGSPFSHIPNLETTCQLETLKGHIEKDVDSIHR